MDIIWRIAILLVIFMCSPVNAIPHISDMARCNVTTKARDNDEKTWKVYHCKNMFPSTYYSEVCPVRRCRGTFGGVVHTGYILPVMKTTNYEDRRARPRQLLVNGGCACVAVKYLRQCVPTT